MTAKELIRLLSMVPEDHEVVGAYDSGFRLGIEVVVLVNDPTDDLGRFVGLANDMQEVGFALDDVQEASYTRVGQ